jgi:heptaprenyl diphosphate synthase
VATLYHDDVMDGALSRRGLPSINALWGNRVSTIVGTYVMARGMDVLAELGNECLAVVNVAVTQVWQGQMRELEGVYDIDRTEEAYIESISQKTAAFYQLPCALGAMAAGAEPRVTDALKSFGRFTGAVFQIVDDVLDLVGDQKALGKPTGGDIRAGVYTLPVIHALSKSHWHYRLRSLLAQESMNDATNQEAIELVQNSGAIGYALGRANEFMDRALSELDRLTPSLAADALGTTAQMIVERPELKPWIEKIV